MYETYLKLIIENGLKNFNSQEFNNFKEFLMERKTLFADQNDFLHKTNLRNQRMNLSDRMPSKEAPRRFIV